MSITSAIVLFAVIWFLVFLIVIPIRLKTQGDVGDVVPGTHASAPHEPQFRRRALITTGISAVLWVVIAGIILSGVVSVRDLDWRNVMGSETATGETDE